MNDRADLGSRPDAEATLATAVARYAGESTTYLGVEQQLTVWPGPARKRIADPTSDWPLDAFSLTTELGGDAADSTRLVARNPGTTGCRTTFRTWLGIGVVGTAADAYDDLPPWRGSYRFDKATVTHTPTETDRPGSTLDVRVYGDDFRRTNRTVRYSALFEATDAAVETVEVDSELVVDLAKSELGGLRTERKTMTDGATVTATVSNSDAGEQ
ncbi:hypothetical protein [Haloarchaeobius iranensis]|uniref:hypothetical protein n=1 Tax=Haloarchaeobius iranensis TaxID=996166 RepID=UPI000B7E9216|nr:hypothetical protein [Haloarchaeobius iranensis]